MSFEEKKGWVVPFYFFVFMLDHLSLDEMDLQEPLQVQVGHLSLVIHAQQLGQCGVGDDATLEARIVA